MHICKKYTTFAATFETYKIKKLFIKEKEPDYGYDENTPEHLRTLFAYIKKDKDDTQLFNTLFPNIVELKDTEELSSRILTEK